MARSLRPLDVYPITVRTLDVLRVADVTPGMRRVTLGGAELAAHTAANGYPVAAFRSDGFDDEGKLILQHPDAEVPVAPTQADGVLDSAAATTRTCCSAPTRSAAGTRPPARSIWTSSSTASDPRHRGPTRYSPVSGSPGPVRNPPPRIRSGRIGPLSLATRPRCPRSGAGWRNGPRVRVGRCSSRSPRPRTGNSTCRFPMGSRSPG